MILLFIIATPILLVNLGYIHTPSFFFSEGDLVPWFGIYVLVGVLISLFGIVFESIADRQLSNFMKVKKPGQIVITFLLVFVSGIPMQEARYAGRPKWEEYKKKTSAFIPWFSKK
jgi:steroid 5-alpha reductase family enzyme